MQLPILYHDNDLVVVNKPAGLLVHRTQLDRQETRFAMQMVRDLIGKQVFPVHRLDRPTSGALIFALSAETARQMALQFGGQRVNKRYLAIVRGIPSDSVTIDYPLKEELDAICDRMAGQNKPAQAALTHIQRLADVELPVSVDRYPTSRYSLVRATPKTGRKHQIRRHLRHIGHPIVGDVTHGVGKHNRYFTETYSIRRLLLACTEISFLHPHSGAEVRIKAPLCSEFQNLMGRLGWSEYVGA